MKKSVWLAGFIGLILVALGLFFMLTTKAQTISIGESSYRYDIADEPDERITGLSGRQTLDSDQALLFIFDSTDYHGIWMKDMNFAIDIIWLDENKQIVGIKENATPESYPESFTPEAPAKYVVELNTGEAKNSGAQLGDTVKF